MGEGAESGGGLILHHTCLNQKILEGIPPRRLDKTSLEALQSTPTGNRENVEDAGRNQ
jgi:hypothetical protein